MVEIWFVLLCGTVIIFAILDGWNIGAGAVHLFVARTAPERRQAIAALGPLWSWHEVWLIAAGGTFLLAFPGIMAAAFSGFYLALWMVLWALVLRGIAIEVGGHLDDDLWQSGWDTAFALASVLLAVLFGAAIGNVIRGVPLDATGRFSMSLFTHFGVRGRVGILDWYTVSVAVFTTALLAAHGATYLTMKTLGSVHDRSATLSRWLWIAAAALFLVVTAETWIVRPSLFVAMAGRPAGWLAGTGVAVGGWAVVTGLRGRAEQRALAGSSTLIASLIAGAAAGAFPDILHSTLSPEHTVTAYDGATSVRGLSIALIWWPVAFALALTYAVVVTRRFAGRVQPVDVPR